MYDINIWSIVVASVAAFAIGALCYSPILFGKEWTALMKISDKDMAEARAKGGMWKSYLAHFAATLVSFAVLAFFMASSAAVTATDGAFYGFLVWLGFSATMGVSALLWQKQPFKLVLIETVNILLGLVIGGAIIGAWR